VLLFSLGFFEAVPLDTWIRTTIEEYYPDCERGNYTDTSRAIREQFGGEFAGYAQQTYVFHPPRGGGVARRESVLPGAASFRRQRDLSAELSCRLAWYWGS